MSDHSLNSAASDGGDSMRAMSPATKKWRDVRSMRSLRAKLNIKMISDTGLEEARRQARAYEYLCHLEEAKRWLEGLLDAEMPSSNLKFEEDLSNGVLLCRLGNYFAPDIVKNNRIFDLDESVFKERGLVFRHTDNIAKFLRAMKSIAFPEHYFPTVTDVYERKNLPRAIYCIHALSIYLAKLGVAPEMEDLHGVAEFSAEDIQKMDEKIDQAGIALPTFSAISVPDAPKDAVKVNPKKPVKPVKPKHLEPKQSFSIYWPFMPGYKQPWLYGSRRSHAAGEDLAVEMDERVAALKEQRMDQETSQIELQDLLKDQFPHLIDAIQTAYVDDEPDNDIEDLSPCGNSAEEQLRLRTYFQDALDDFMAWDHIFWASYRPYMIHWPLGLVPYDEGEDIEQVKSYSVRRKDSISSSDGNDCIVTNGFKVIDKLVQDCFPHLTETMKRALDENPTDNMGSLEYDITRLGAWDDMYYGHLASLLVGEGGAESTKASSRRDSQISTASHSSEAHDTFDVNQPVVLRRGLKGGSNARLRQTRSSIGSANNLRKDLGKAKGESSRLAHVETQIESIKSKKNSLRRGSYEIAMMKAELQYLEDEKAQIILNPEGPEFTRRDSSIRNLESYLSLLGQEEDVNDMIDDSLLDGAFEEEGDFDAMEEEGVNPFAEC